MPRISALFTNHGVPVTTPANTPTIRIRRQDTQALVVTDAAMTEQGDGNFSYDFAEDPTLEYVFRCDGDPTAAGQTTVYERYVSGSFSGITEARIEADIPAILVDTETTLPGLIASLNDVSVADILAAVLGSGESVDTALSRLDNMDVAVEKIRKVTTNRVLVNATDTLVTVYEDDDSTPAFSFTISVDRRDRTPV